MATMAAAGMGMTVLPRFVGDATAGLRLITTPTPGPQRKRWPGVHRTARSIPRIRITLRFIVEAFTHMRTALRPTRAEPAAADLLP